MDSGFHKAFLINDESYIKEEEKKRKREKDDMKFNEQQ